MIRLEQCILDDVLIVSFISYFRGRYHLELQLPFNSYFIYKWLNHSVIVLYSDLSHGWSDSNLVLKSIALCLSTLLWLYVISFGFP